MRISQEKEVVNFDLYHLLLLLIIIIKASTPGPRGKNKVVYKLLMLFFYNKNINLPIIKIGKNKINKTSVTKLLSTHLEKN